MPDPTDPIRLGQRTCSYAHENASGGEFYRCSLPAGEAAPEGKQAFDIVSVSPEDPGTRALVDRLRPPVTNHLDVGGGPRSCGVVLRTPQEHYQHYVCRDDNNAIKRVTVARLHLGADNSQTVAPPTRDNDATRVVFGILTDPTTEVATASHTTGNIHGQVTLGEHSATFRIHEGDPGSLSFQFSDGARISLDDPYIVDLMRQRALGQLPFASQPPGNAGFSLK